MPAFGRVPSIDPRNANFPYQRLVSPQSLRSYTWTCPIHLDQGQLGSCVGHGWTHARDARPKSHVVTEQDALAIYYRAQQLDEYPGENYEGTSVLGGAKAMQEKGWISSYTWAKSLTDVLHAIGYAGPVVIGVNWLAGMMDTDGNGQIHATGAVEGGHCVALVGVSIPKKLVRVHNSWSTSWGYGGDAFLSFDDLERLLGDQGDACIPVKTK